MQKKTNRPLLLLTGLIAALLVVSFATQRVGKKAPQPPITTQTTSIKQADAFSYKGEDGKDALVLLKEKTTIEQNKSGLVVSINNRKADEKKREYWSFYVNGKLANVGPAEYQTKKGDKIEWKIEKY